MSLTPRTLRWDGRTPHLPFTPPLASLGASVCESLGTVAACREGGLQGAPIVLETFERVACLSVQLGQMTARALDC
jgi:hypothetical protein